MNHISNSTSPEESRKFPVKTLLVTVVILAAAVAVFVFNVPVLTVLSYGFLGLMLFGHFFMHGSHGGHDHSASPSQQNSEHNHTDPNVTSISAHNHTDGPATQGDAEAKSEKDQNSHQGHSGCC
jgi:fatty acid desaturase